MVWQFYRRCLQRRPLVTQMVSSGLMTGGGDFICQSCVERRRLQNYDVVRTTRFFGIGCFFLAPVIVNWYRLLERVTVGGPKLFPLVRVVMDQALCSPVLLSCFLSLLRLTEGKTVSDTYKSWQKEFLPIYMTGLKIWPLAQVVNFYLVPLEHRLLFVQAISLGWNTYLAYATSHSPAPGGDSSDLSSANTKEL